VAQYLAQDIEYGIANAVNDAHGRPWAKMTPAERTANGFGAPSALSLDECMRLAKKGKQL